MNIRELVVDEATAAVGLGANPARPELRKQFIDLIAPGETPHMVSAMVQMSTCALTVGGIWRKAGLKDKRLDPPYKIGSAIARLIEIAKEHKCWHVYRGKGLPGLGDMVLVGDNKTGGTEHVYTVVNVDEQNKVLESVDGGMRDAQGYQLVKARKRSWAFGSDVPFEGATPVKAVGGRKIIGWIDVSALPIPVVDIYKDD